MINSFKSSVGRMASARTLLTPSAMRMLLPMLLLAAGITALAMMYLWHDEASYKPVFGAQERVPAAEMMAVLDAEQVTYRIHPASGQVLVPERELGRVRMLLAGKGVVAKLPDGLELVDKNDPLGVSQFVQDVRFRRGLEGELAQSIMALGPVANARVHLSLARSTSFVSSDGEKSSASVMLSLKPGLQLNAEQTLAVINLVSGSVATLEPQRVTVVDQDGNFLSAHVDAAEAVAGLAGGSDAASRFRGEALRNVRDLLASTLGEGNYKVSVTADVDNDRVEETREQYGEAPKVTNEAVRDEQDQDPTALGVPGSLSNRPLAIDASSPTGAAPSMSRKNASTRQYAYDRTITQVKRARGELKRLSVAVILNNAASPVPAKGWSQEQLANIDRILRNGLGLDAERGDKLVVSSLNFPTRGAELPWWQERGTVETGVSYGATALLLLLGWLLLVRPLLKILRQWVSTRAQPVELNELAIEPQPALVAPAPQAAMSESAATSALGAPSVMPMVPLLENYDLPPAGSSVDVLVEHLKTLAGKEPERVAEVVKQWVQKRG